MFVGFNAKISKEGFISPYFKTLETERIETQKREIQSQLKDYVLNDGFLDATLIENDWFPNISANVFISHSHRDYDLAVGFAGWLYTVFGIKSFIDSCVWGYADDLLKIIDEKYCVNELNPDGSVSSFDYNKRNRSTSHVHMILNAALHKMIDKTECLMFLNTSNSLLTSDLDDNSATSSPWIYSELIFSRMCQKKKLSYYRENLTHSGLLEYAELNVKYDVSLDHLIELDNQDLINLWKRKTNKIPELALDDLYIIKGVLPTGE